MKPLVSVIIPVYNCQEYIDQTIDSVLSQTYSNFELILVDDGSTDDTHQIIESYLSDKRIRLIKNKNGGVCQARNLGITQANGSYICCMDHDDYWHPEKLAMQVKILNENPEVGLIFSAFTLWQPDDATQIYPAPNKLFGHDTLSNEIDQKFTGWIYHLLLLDCWILTSTAMIRASVFEQCGVFDETLPYSEDWDLWLRISRQYAGIKLKDSTTLYRQHTEQGNRKVRDIDYRTTLLLKAKQQWGLCSPNGQCLSEWQFRRQLAKYHAEFAFHQLQNNGDRKVAYHALLKAWRTYPIQMKYLIYLCASLLGWKPKW